MYNKYHSCCQFSVATRITSGFVEDTFIGRPEVFNLKERRWEIVVTTSWTTDDANAVCRETGYGEALEHIPKNLIGKLSSLNQTLFPKKRNTDEKKQWKKNCTDSDYSIWLCKNSNGREHSKSAVGVGVRCRAPGRNIMYFITYQSTSNFYFRTL